MRTERLRRNALNKLPTLVAVENVKVLISSLQSSAGYCDTVDIHICLDIGGVV